MPMPWSQGESFQVVDQLSHCPSSVHTWAGDPAPTHTSVSGHLVGTHGSDRGSWTWKGHQAGSGAPGWSLVDGTGCLLGARSMACSPVLDPDTDSPGAPHGPLVPGCRRAWALGPPELAVLVWPAWTPQGGRGQGLDPLHAQGEPPAREPLGGRAEPAVSSPFCTGGRGRSAQRTGRRRISVDSGSNAPAGFYPHRMPRLTPQGRHW